MKRTLARAATLALALPLAAVFASGSAQADPITATVPGCWGAGTNDTIVCNLVASVETPSPSVQPIFVKVCAGTCQDVPVPFVNPGTGSTRVCASYQDGWGTTHNNCSSNILGSIADIDLSRYLVELFPCSAALCAHM